MNADLSRRSFVLAATTAASSLYAYGANDRVRLGIIGSGNRGSYLMSVANQVGGIEWKAICDAWDVRRNDAQKLAGGSAELYSDYRRLLDRKDVDGVIVATTDHLHSQISVEACRAGKDVYVEKPMTSLPMQGHEVVKAVRETNRVLQVGTQQRSISHFAEAKQRFFDSGMIGQVNIVRTIWNANTGYLEKPPAGMEQKPAGLDWDAVLGWLPKIPWDPKRYFNRFSYWDFSTGGQTGGLFVHMIDVVHWFMGINKPLSAVALGGIYRYNDGRDTPDNINFILDYPNVNVTFEATITDLNGKESADIVFMGSNGRLHIFRGGYRYIPAEKGAEEIRVKGTTETTHMANWLDCIRSRKQPNASVIDGHYSSMACHIGNVAYKGKTRVEWKKEWDV